MNKIADGKRHDEKFQFGDHVLVNLQPCRHIFVATRNSNKFCARYFVPFTMLKHVGQVTYQLALSATAKIHDVFHVSLLKPLRWEVSGESMQLPREIINSHPILEPHVVLQKRVITKQDKDIKQVLTLLHGLPRTAATWEDVEELK